MENLLKVETLKVTDVAKILHKNAEWVRAGLRQGSLPFGNAVQSASGRWNYIIIESKFLDYLGVKFCMWAFMQGTTY